MGPRRRSWCAAALVLPVLGAAPPARAQTLDIPILVPLTGFLSLEGQSQPNGALLALQQAPAGLTIRHSVADTGVSPEITANALEHPLGNKPITRIASMLGTRMLAMLPVPPETRGPPTTISRP